MNIKIDNKKTVLLTTGVIALVMAIFGVTYAYFSTNVINPMGSSINITTVDLGDVTFVDGPEINLGEIYPGTSEEKEFTITRVNAEAGSELFYQVFLYVRENTLTDVADGEFLCSLSGTQSGTGDLINFTDIDVPNSTTILGTGSIIENGTHTYTFEIKLNETGNNQNPTRGNGFNGYLQVEILESSGE